MSFEKFKMEDAKVAASIDKFYSSKTKKMKTHYEGENMRDMSKNDNPKTVTLAEITKGEWEIQGPKIQEDFNNQPYFAIHPKHSYDIVGFLYPYSKHSPEQMQANAAFIVKAVNNHDALLNWCHEIYAILFTSNLLDHKKMDELQAAIKKAEK